MAPIPDVLMKQVDEYVDSLAPQIQPRIATELEAFQKKTIDVLETQVIDAFRSLFDRDGNSSRERSGSPTNAAPGAYGVQSLPFADEIASLTRSFSSLTDEAGDDLRGIFDLTEGRGVQDNSRSRGGGRGDSPGGARGFLSAAVDAVQDHLDKGSGGQGFQLDGILGTISDTVKDASRNPEEKARLISPEIKDKVGETLRKQHAPIAEQFTRIALDHIKRWLRGNTSTRDIGDGAKGEIEDQVKDIVRGVGSLLGSLKHGKEGSSREVGDRHRGEGEEEGSGGFSRVISDKLSTGLAKVHREVRIEFRKVLGGIEKQLFELLPDELQRPLEKILGGNPFDSQLDNEKRSRGDRDIGDDIKDKLLARIRSLMRKVQETLRESILGVVNGGHRKFERESWVFVQSMVEQKVQRYLPKVKISVPDDIGDEGVSVGKPSSGAHIGGGPRPTSPPDGGRPSSPRPHGGRASPPPHGGHEGRTSPHGQQRYSPPPHQQPHHNAPQGYNPPSQYDGRYGGQQGHSPAPQHEKQHYGGPQHGHPPPSQQQFQYGAQQGHDRYSGQDYGGRPQHGDNSYPSQQNQWGSQPDYHR